MAAPRIPAHLPVALLAILLGVPPAAATAPVHPRFDLTSIDTCPFPSNRFTAPDPDQITGRHVQLPSDCAPSSPLSGCHDIAVLNELDGFNLQPRLSIPFDAPIEWDSVTSQSVFLIKINYSQGGAVLPEPGTIGIDQVVRDEADNTLYAECDKPLDQHTDYILVVTNNVLGPNKHPAKPSEKFLNFANPANSVSTGDPVLDQYRVAVRAVLAALPNHVNPPVLKQDVVAASLFTTLSATASLEQMRKRIMQDPAPVADFNLGLSGVTKTVFDLVNIKKVENLTQTKTDPQAQPTSSIAPLGVLRIVPGIGKVAFGRYSSADFRVPGGNYIPQVGTLTGKPAIQGHPVLSFVLFLPSSPEPPNGYPVAIYGHGGKTNRSASGYVAAELAAYGIATIAINAPGSGGGSGSKLRITFNNNQPVTTLLSGGRGVDLDQDGKIDDEEGLDPWPWTMLGRGRGDGLRQWTVDHMELVRMIEAGVDVDGNSVPDLDKTRIYYVGPSSGGREGAILLAVEPDIRGGVLNVPNGSDERLSAVRGNFPGKLGGRVPPLINTPGVRQVDVVPVDPPWFDEDLPLKDGASFDVVLQNGLTETIKSPVTNAKPAALKIQKALDNAEWALQCASSIAFAPFLVSHPLPNSQPKKLIVQFAFGDRRIPNPSTTAFLKAGGLADRATLFRYDKALAANPTDLPPPSDLYPHTFLNLFPNSSGQFKPDFRPNALSLSAQKQIALFFSTDGLSTIDPDDAGPVFETPALSLPTTLNYHF